MSFTNPQDILRDFGLHEGMEVADLGAGAGHYSLAAAEIVGDDGHVCAVDIQKDLVTRLKNEAEKKNYTNLDVLWADIEKPNGTSLSEESFDAVIVSNVLFQTSKKDDLLAEAFRILRSGGKLLLIDWSDSHGGLGPREDHLISKEAMVKLAEGVGLSLQRDITTSPHHWGVVLVK